MRNKGRLSQLNDFSIFVIKYISIVNVSDDMLDKSKYLQVGKIVILDFHI